jgi:hypothetical protein
MAKPFLSKNRMPESFLSKNRMPEPLTITYFLKFVSFSKYIYSNLQLRDFERGVDILVATPDRLADLMETTRISLQAICYLALYSLRHRISIIFCFRTASLTQFV